MRLDLLPVLKIFASVWTTPISTKIDDSSATPEDSPFFEPNYRSKTELAQVTKSFNSYYSKSGHNRRDAKLDATASLVGPESPK